MNIYDTITFDSSNYDLLCIGEMLIDMIGAPEENFKAYFGGSPANIAINVQRLGFKSELVCAVGNDGFGEMLVNKVKENGLSSSYIQKVNAATSMVLLNQTTGTPIPVFYRSADSKIKINKDLIECVKKTKIIHFSSWSISLKETRATAIEILESIRGENKLVGFDPNYHPLVWTEEDSKDELFKFIKNCDIVKPSIDDGIRLFGTSDAQEIIQSFHELGVEIVVLTMGEDGAIISDGKNQYFIPTVATSVVDATGAGDAFWSGFYSGVLSGKSLVESAIIGSYASAYKLKYVGAISPLPPMNELITLYTK